ncbi:MAG: lipopolysaccharide biosynthesis protein [Gammaproteobacteria bacterium]
MQEVFEQLLLYARGIWKYRWYAIILATGLIIAGWALLSKSPVIYTASAKIYVKTSTVLKPLLQGLAIEKDPGAYLGLMTRELVSRPILEQVANKVTSDSKFDSPQEKERFLFAMERSIRVDAIRANEGANQRDFYVISYYNQDPGFAKMVVETLINTFVDKTVAASEQDSEAAKSFLDQQIKKRQEELIFAETQIAKFKSEHVDELPQEGVDYFRRLQAVQAAYDEVKLKITEAQNQRRELQRQLASTPARQRALSVDGKPVLSAAAVRLEEAKTRLNELLLKFTERHPDVIAVRRSITELEKKAQADSSPVVPNPVYQQIQVSLGQVESEIAALRAREFEYSDRIEKLRNQTVALTEVEAKLQRLNENYEHAKQKYDTLVARRGSATMAENVEQASEDVRFRIIDPPRIINSEQNLIRKQLIMTSGVLVAGFAGGGALAFLLSQLWPVVYARREQESLYGVPVICMISQVKDVRTKIREYADISGFVLVGVIILVVHGAVVWQNIGTIKYALAGSAG